MVSSQFGDSRGEVSLEEDVHIASLRLLSGENGKAWRAPAVKFALRVRVFPEATIGRIAIQRGPTIVGGAEFLERGKHSSDAFAGRVCNDDA